ncbi:MAG: hypothetical protein AVDCRST_MAG65-1574, partial [uncultured Solirubrobacteraceae bacterium]
GRRRQGRAEGPPEGSRRRPDRRSVAEERGQGRPRDRRCQGRRWRRRRQAQKPRQPRRQAL